jgi:hypothetical protein
MSLDDNVYAPPSADLNAASAGPSAAPAFAPRPFRDSGRLAVATVLGLVGTELLAIGYFFWQPTPERLQREPALALATFAVGLVSTAISIATVVGFCMWFFRVCANLPSLGIHRPRFTPGWAVGYFFIPVVNLFRPYQVAREAWAATQRGPNDAWIVTAWWASWIGRTVLGWFVGILGTVAMFNATAEGRLPDLEWLQSIQKPALAVGTACSAFACLMVLGLSRRQREAAAKLGVDAR